MKRYHTIAELPEVLPIFPLGGALLLPRAELPLNIFEDRYLQMFDAAVSTHRMIGMIQPDASGDENNPQLLRIGCVGRITSYSETNDNRLLIGLTGVCRFEIIREKKVKSAWRQCIVTYDGFAADLVTDNQARTVNRSALVTAFRQYLEANNMTANWEEVEKVSTENLVNTLSQMAPYPAAEKQALLEAPDLKTRADMLIALTELALAKQSGSKGRNLQ
jgi:Lon protease-like protein